MLTKHLAFTIAFVAAVNGCTTKSSIDIGHDTPDGGDGLEGGASAIAVDGAASTATVSTPISCAYGWVVSTSSPLDVCCEKSNLVTSACAVIARGDRPYTCNVTSDGCGCAYGAGGHRYELRCNEASGCTCISDGYPRYDLGVLPYACPGGAGAVDDTWRTTCGFPGPDTPGITAVTPCPYGYTPTSTSTSCCKGTLCQPSNVDSSTPCSAAGKGGCGCTMTKDLHDYALKCDANGCVCAVDGYPAATPPTGDTCSSNATILEAWNHGCGFPARTE